LLLGPFLLRANKTNGVKVVGNNEIKYIVM